MKKLYIPEYKIDTEVDYNNRLLRKTLAMLSACDWAVYLEILAIIQREWRGKDIDVERNM